MSNSSLVSYTSISPNSSNPRNHKIDTITIHHCAGVASAEVIAAIFAKPSRKASCNYGIGNDGKIALIVDEKNRSWCSSSSSNDNRAITIEVSNSSTGGNWPISDKAMDSLIKLCVDICKRNDIKKLNFTGNKNGNLTMHKWFAATGCPGQYLEGKFSWIADQVNKQLGVVEEDKKVEAEKPVSNNTSNIYRVRKSWSNVLSQKGAFSNLDNAKKVCDQAGAGYYVFDKSGKAIYPVINYVDVDNRIDTVEEVQKWLNNSYGAKLKEDGIYGPQTKKALVKVLQKAFGVSADGIYGNQTNAAIKVLKRGGAGEAVKALQGLLVCNGYPNAYVDGHYGNATFESVKLYQSKNKLASDGMAGKATFKSLCK